ncbi:MAG TPA: hypothetical protein VJO52_10565 [Gemmatimonadaceae bacterium]|nr:hypothetical protein [Gemmatimonadaceae bacterium]
MTLHGKGLGDVVQQRHVVEQRLSHDFLDRALEWRRVLAECWGTFLLVVVAAGANVVAAGSLAAQGALGVNDSTE